MRDLSAFFEDHDEDSHDFAGVQGAESLSGPADLCALQLVSLLCPTAKSVIGAAERDKVWLNADPDTLNLVATDQQLLTLIRCGVGYDEDEDGFYLFV